ncbi:hypothetical protein [Clostridium sp.]|uniref:hypothetical protein n=1 Tax=Clostridium sp. TaxID=1506 RepID=UPI003217E11B
MIWFLELTPPNTCEAECPREQSEKKKIFDLVGGVSLRAKRKKKIFNLFDGVSSMKER